MNTEYYFTDSSPRSLQYNGDDDVTVDGFDVSDLETVTLDSPWNDFFDTDEYVTFDATVAQPIVQPYFYDGELQYFKKSKSELQSAQAQINHSPWTVGHPPDKHVTDTSQIRGFWTEPRYEEGQRATLHIPVTDEDGIQFALDNEELSVGFRGSLDWADDDEAEYDAVQRNYVYDHIASVERGRCSKEQGCGINVTDEKPDSDTHGHIYTDAVRSSVVEDPLTSTSTFSVGSWVTYDNRRGRIEDRHTTETVTIDGTTIDASDRDEPIYTVSWYDETDQRLTTKALITESKLHSATKPPGFTDECSAGPCSCGRHIDGSIMDTIEYDGLASGTLDESALPTEGYESHYVFAAETKSESSYPLVDADGQLRRGNVKAAWEVYGHAEDEGTILDVLAQANKRFADADGFTAPIDDSSLSEAMADGSSDTMTTFEELLNDSDITREDVLDHYEIETKESPTEFYDGEPTPADLAEDFDAVDMLIDEKETLAEQNEQLKENVRESKRPQFADKAAELAELTERWGDEDDLMERFDADDEDERWTVDDLEAKIELVEDVRGDTASTTTPSQTVTDEQSEYVADNTGTVSDTDIDRTQGGRYDLRSVRSN